MAENLGSWRFFAGLALMNTAIAMGAADDLMIRDTSRRMPPEEEAAWREAERRGQGEEWLRKRLRRGARRPP